MKIGGYLNRYTRLKPGKPLNRSGYLNRGSQLPRRSPKHLAANRRAERERAKYLAAHPRCFICIYAKYVAITTHKTRPATCVHHLAGRDAKRCELFEVVANYCPICDEHHTHVTNEAVQTAGLCWEARKFADPATADLATLKRLNPRRFRKVGQ